MTLIWVQQESQFLTSVSNQNRNGWQNFQRPPKEVLEKIYQKYPRAPRPSELSGRQTISSKDPKQPASDTPYAHPPNPFAGPWPPYSGAGPFGGPPYPPWPTPGPSYTPFHPQYPPTTHPGVPPNPPSDDGTHNSPSDDEPDLKYPLISDFFEELMTTESDHHHFTNYADSFNDQGYYRLDELGDESVTVEHMVMIIENLKEGTARVIKRKALEKLRRIRKGKGKRKK